jgi:hypothetical protein
MNILRHFQPVLSRMVPNAGNRRWLKTRGAVKPSDISPSGILPGSVGVAYSQQFTTTGGTPTPGFYLYSGTLPPGLTLTASGLYSGTPTTAGAYNFILAAGNAGGVALQPISHTINP